MLKYESRPGSPSPDGTLWTGPLLADFIKPPLILDSVGLLDKKPQIKATNGFVTTTYVSALPLGDGRVINIVVIGKKTGERSAEWFFSTFESKPHNARSKEEEEEYQKKIGTVPVRANRKTEKELTGLLLDAEPAQRVQANVFYFQD